MVDIQEILAFMVLFAAIFFLVRTFFWKKKGGKGCGTDDSCGSCH
ncbi:FeoB-associated Cys-rich membrane protein [Flavobacterium tegetincola]|nr:FeoB-associated Cys-rich membrane protein [Flavobacterium tegetincola]